MELYSKCMLQQFNVICSALKDLRSETKTHDVFLVCDGVKFPAHRSVLQIGSKYFKTMFSSNLPDAFSKEVTFPTIRKQSLAIILDCIYLKEVNIEALSDEQIWNLLSSAHLLEVQPVIEVCVDELVNKITSKNWVMVWREAQKYSLERLVFSVVKHLAASSDEYIFGDKELMKLGFVSFNALISNRSWQKFNSGDTLIRLVLSWVGADKTERNHYLRTLFSAIDFASVSKDVITKLSKNNDLFNENPQLAQSLLQKISEACNPLPELNTTNPKLLIFKSNSVFSFDLRKQTWTVHSLLETLTPEQNSPIAVSGQAVYYTAETGVKFSRRHEVGEYSKRAEQMHIIAYYPNLNCGNEIATVSKMTNFGMAFLGKSLYFVGGGKDGNLGNCSFECLNLSSKLKKRLAPAKVGRINPALVNLGNNLYLLGGRSRSNCLYNSNATDIRDVEMYSPPNDQWTIISTLHSKIGGNIVVVPCLSKIYVTNKEFLGLASPNLFEFDPGVNSWKEFGVGNCGVLCGSSTPLQCLVFENDNKYYQMDAREKKLVFITKKHDGKDIQLTTGGRHREEIEITVIFA